MKVAIPVDEDKKTVCIVFGRAPYFMICDTETGSTEFKENPAIDAQGGAGIKAAQFVVDIGAEYLVTVRCGENSAEVFKEADIKIYKSTSTDAIENVELLKKGELDELTKFHGGYHGKL